MNTFVEQGGEEAAEVETAFELIGGDNGISWKNGFCTLWCYFDLPFMSLR